MLVPSHYMSAPSGGGRRRRARALRWTETRHTNAGLVEAKAGRLDGRPEASERRGAAAAGGLLLMSTGAHERLPGVVQVQPVYGVLELVAL
jgi:hypothetical protein